MSEKLLTVDEVARYLGISEEAVKDLVEKGQLPAYKIGGAFLRFKREQIETYQRRRRSMDEAKSVLLRDRGIKKVHTESLAPALLEEEEGYISKTGTAVEYTAWERLLDFFYYNDFYILSFLLLLAIVLFVLEF